MNVDHLEVEQKSVTLKNVAMKKLVIYYLQEIQLWYAIEE